MDAAKGCLISLVVGLLVIGLLMLFRIGSGPASICGFAVIFSFAFLAPILFMILNKMGIIEYHG